ncbi:hypothetical protein AB0D04_37350 [Streptomyces sp. NPDC048483]|uniref:hypothetical protein n=1 Tax=Streptomyces sp. NPDC048483 TaxID=3154927 RepID=UPI003413AA99
MTELEDDVTGTVQNADATGNARVTQVGHNYEEHHHRYVRGWEYLRGVGVDNHEMDLVENAFVDTPGAHGAGQVAHAVSMMKRVDGRSHALVLLGEPGVGRRAAALRVLRDAGVPRERIRWLVLDWDRPRTEQIPHTKGHGFVLDLTGYRSLPEDFYTGLADYQKEAEAAEAFLIILATPGTWAPGAFATMPSVRLVHPPAKEIAEAHLRHLAAGRLDWLTGVPLDALLAEATQASDAARLAWLVAQATEDDRDSVKQEYTDWKQHLHDWFERYSAPEDLRERALLVAAALLEGVPAGVVLEAADQLFVEVGGVLPPGGALAGRDLDLRLGAIEASSVGGGESISLDAEHHGLAGAVLQYVWQQRPQLRRGLLEWASRISAPNGIAVRHLRRVATSLAQLSLLPGGATVLSVASTWIDTGRSAHRELAVEVLETMALHPLTGAGVRKQLYDWAHQKNTSEALAQAVAEICSGRLGQTYPRIALTRLRLLASREDGRAHEAVAKAVRTLASTPEQRTLVLSEIVDWSESANEAVRRAGASTFLALADGTGDNLLPLPIAQEPADDSIDALAGQLFTSGWRAALIEPDTAERAYAQLAAWLDSPVLSDDQVLPLTAEILRGSIGREGPAALLVSHGTDLGRTRRRTLLDQLLSEQSASLTVVAPVTEPGSDGLPTTA